MPYLSSWEEFSKAAELLYLEDPDKCRFVMKYRHNDGKLVVKVTDNQVCLMYLAEQSQDVKKVEKLSSQLMRHMVSKE
ncbi:Signal recognition particle 9 kDa protein [Halotydeus destructor]|nr:Signal recognition particle 9 kDa protein [Halotydeus destructor]